MPFPFFLCLCFAFFASLVCVSHFAFHWFTLFFLLLLFILFVWRLRFPFRPVCLIFLFLLFVFSSRVVFLSFFHFLCSLAFLFHFVFVSFTYPFFVLVYRFTSFVSVVSVFLVHVVYHCFPFLYSSKCVLLRFYVVVLYVAIEVLTRCLWRGERCCGAVVLLWRCFHWRVKLQSVSFYASVVW